MKNLEISTYGVEEMTSQEMLEKDGGGYIPPISTYLTIFILQLIFGDDAKKEDSSTANQKK